MLIHRYFVSNVWNYLISVKLQTTSVRENVIHLARTPEEKGSDSASEASYISEKTEVVKNLLSVSEAWVADHAKHLTRMLPGGLFVQGTTLFSIMFGPISDYKS